MANPLKILTQLSASKEAQFADVVEMQKTVTISGAEADLKVTGGGEISGSGAIKAAGAAQLGSSLAVAGNTNLASALDVKGAAALSGTLAVSGVANFSSDLSASAGVNVAGAVNLGSNLDVAGHMKAVGEISGSAALNVGGASHLKGAAQLDSTLSVDGNADFDGTLSVVGNISSQASASIAGDLDVDGKADISGSLDVHGNAVVYGNLEVKGTTTTINSQTVSIKDANIELAVPETGSATDATADGAGITIKGATDKTFQWNNNGNGFSSSEDINLAAGKAFKIDGVKLVDSDGTVNTFYNAAGVASMEVNADFVKVKGSDGLLIENGMIEVNGVGGELNRSITAAYDIFTGGKLLANGDISGSANLAVSGSAHIDEELAVGGVAAFASDISASAGVDISGKTYFHDDVSLDLGKSVKIGENYGGILTSGDGTIVLNGNEGGSFVRLNQDMTVDVWSSALNITAHSGSVFENKVTIGGGRLSVGPVANQSAADNVATLAVGSNNRSALVGIPVELVMITDKFGHTQLKTAYVTELYTWLDENMASGISISLVGGTIDSGQIQGTITSLSEDGTYIYLTLPVEYRECLASNHTHMTVFDSGLEGSWYQLFTGATSYTGVFQNFGAGSVVLGQGNKVYADNSVAIGQNNTVYTYNSLAVNSSTVAAYGSVGFNGSMVRSQHSFAVNGIVGPDASQGLALGGNVFASQAVALNGGRANAYRAVAMQNSVAGQLALEATANNGIIEFSGDWTSWLGGFNDGFLHYKLDENDNYLVSLDTVTFTASYDAGQDITTITLDDATIDGLFVFGSAVNNPFHPNNADDIIVKQSLAPDYISIYKFGDKSFAHGHDSTAVGNNSHAEGEGTVAIGYAQHAEGKWNAINSSALHIIGNGADSDNRSNILEVYSDRMALSGNLGVTGVASFASDISASAGLDVAAAAHFADAVDMDSTLNVDGIASFQAAVSGAAGLDMNGAAAFHNDVSMDAALNLSGSAFVNITTPVVNGKYNVNTAIRDLDARVGQQGANINQAYADLRYLNSASFDANGMAAFTSSFPVASIHQVTVDVLVQAGGSGPWTNDLVSVQVKAAGSYVGFEISAPAMGTSDKVRIIAVKESGSLA